MWGRELGLWGLSVPFSGVRSGCFGGEIGVQPPHLESRSGGAPKVGGPGLLPGAPPPWRCAAAAHPAQHSDRSPAGPAPAQAPPPTQAPPRPPRPAARPFSCGSGVSRRHRRHKLPRWRRAGGCEQRSGRAGRGAGPAAGGQGGAGLAPRTRSRKQGRPAGGRNAAADAHEVRDGQGWPGARVGGHGGARPRGQGRGRARARPTWGCARGRGASVRRAWAGRTRTPGAGPSLPGLCGSGVRWGAGGGGPRAQSPRGRAGLGRRSLERAGVSGRAGAGSLCLFISNLIRTASGELRCLTGGRAPIMQRALRLRPPLTGGFCYF